MGFKGLGDFREFRVEGSAADPARLERSGTLEGFRQFGFFFWSVDLKGGSAIVPGNPKFSEAALPLWGRCVLSPLGWIFRIFPKDPLKGFRVSGAVCLECHCLAGCGRVGEPTNSKTCLPFAAEKTEACHPRRRPPRCMKWRGRGCLFLCGESGSPCAKPAFALCGHAAIKVRTLRASCLTAGRAGCVWRFFYSTRSLSSAGLLAGGRRGDGADPEATTHKLLRLLEARPTYRRAAQAGIGGTPVLYDPKACQAVAEVSVEDIPGWSSVKKPFCQLWQCCSGQATRR